MITLKPTSRLIACAALLAAGSSIAAGAQTTPATPAAPAPAKQTAPAPAKPAAPATTVPATPSATAPATPQTNAPATSAPATAAPTAPAPAMSAATMPANPTVGGAAMIATKTIVENASAAPNLSTLVTAVKAAGLVETLAGPGPFTVFAPTNDAFGRLAPGTVDTLLKPENKASLTKILTYHVVPGTITLDQIREAAKAGGGKVTYTTVEGQPLVVEVANGTVSITDVGGGKSFLETPDVRQSNGIVHVVNGVLVPKLK